MLIKKSYIERLDFLLNRMVERDSLVTSVDLWNTKFYQDREKCENDFNRFLKIFQDLNIADTNCEDDNIWIRPNFKTVDVQEKRGFNQIFKEEKKKENEQLAKLKFNSRKEQLNLVNLKLQNENLNYQKTFRHQREVIDRLTVENLKLQNKNFKRFVLYSIISFITGLIIGNFKLIVSYF